jgi:hypothetical protein
MPSDTQHAAPPAGRPVLHPATGALIFAVDWLFFGADALSLGLSTVVTSLAAFAIAAAGTWWVQRTRARDSRTRAAIKALFGGVVAGIPTSIAGTAVGAAVLMLSGRRRR